MQAPSRMTIAKIPKGEFISVPIPADMDPKVYMARLYSAAAAVARTRGRWIVTRRVGNHAQIARVA